MPRSFDMATDYQGSVEQVHEALRDEQYWLARLADSGADDATLNAIRLTPDGGVDVTTTQVLRADRLPAVVTQFHRGDVEIRRVESWTGLVDGLADAAVSGSIPGAPVTLTGNAQLVPSDLWARLAFRATVEVRIPLVGGKVENFIGNQLVDLLIAEQRFTTMWIAENG
jgi:Protein of unknown function (DUF2505)